MNLPQSLKKGEWKYALYIIPVFILVALSFLFIGGRISLPFFDGTLTISWDDFIIIGIVGTLITPALRYRLERIRKTSIDDSLPILLSNIADSSRTGLTLTRAIQLSAEQDYGPLSTETNKLASQLSWRVPLDKALNSFADRCDTVLTRRASVLITEASIAGGDIQESIETISNHVRNLQDLDKKRRSELRLYTFMVYISFIVYLVTVFLLITQFFTTFSEINLAGWMMTPIPLEEVKQLLLWATIIEGFFGGLIAGKMSSGAMKYGITHSVILLTLSFIVFKFFI